MEAFDQIRVEDECDDYELGHSASACMHYIVEFLQSLPVTKLIAM